MFFWNTCPCLVTTALLEPIHHRERVSTVDFERTQSVGVRDELGCWMKSRCWTTYPADLRHWVLLPVCSVPSPLFIQSHGPNLDDIPKGPRYCKCTRQQATCWILRALSRTARVMTGTSSRPFPALDCRLAAWSVQGLCLQKFCFIIQPRLVPPSPTSPACRG